MTRKEAEFKEITLKLKNLAQENEAIKVDFDSEKGARDSLEKENGGLKTENTKLGQELESLQQELEAIKQDYEKARRDLDELHKAENENKEKIDRLEISIVE